MRTVTAVSLMVLSLASGALQAREYRYTDAHLHYVDFFQNSEGILPLLSQMDEHRIDDVMISGVAVAKKWHENEPRRPRYYAGDDAGAYWFTGTDAILAHALLDLPEQQRERFHPFLTGFNPNDKNSDEHIRRTIEMFPGLWKGIGEVFTRHDDLTALTHGDVPRANSEAMTRVYYLAAEFDMPVMVHSNITSKREREPLYLHEIEEPLRAHPKVRFIWAHAGTSAEIHRRQERLEFLHDTLDRMLATYSNLYIDLSWSMLDTYLLDEAGEADAEWVRLVERYPDRFMIGSDVVGRFDNLGKHLSRFDAFLDALQEDIALKVAQRNFLAILPKRPVIAEKK